MKREKIKQRLIQMIQDDESAYPRRGLTRRTLIRAFDKSRRSAAEDELSSLISSGYLSVVGTGRRGQPFKVLTNGTWPFDKCPMCGHQTTHGE